MLRALLSSYFFAVRRRRRAHFSVYQRLLLILLSDEDVVLGIISLGAFSFSPPFRDTLMASSSHRTLPWATIARVASVITLVSPSPQIARLSILQRAISWSNNALGTPLLLLFNDLAHFERCCCYLSLCAILSEV